MENNYEKAINLLTSREKFHICLGLERVAQALKMLGNPQEKLNIIHVAGTNGKGSTCAILSQILTCAGYKTGLYTSPHIVEYTERIKINQKNISKTDFADIITEISLLAKVNGIYLTEFELLTVSAYKYFADKEVDICVIETGLGGRLDATSAISKNLLSIITSISCDHVDRLGDTIEKIAFEKAGIIKTKNPVLISSKNSGFEVVQKVAKEKNSRIILANKKVELCFENGNNYVIYQNKKYKFNILGLWQQENLELVFGAINYLNSIGYEIEEVAVQKALETVSWACRMQYIPKFNLILDGTHNPDGARILKESLDYYFPEKKRVWVYGSLTTKDYPKIMQILFNTSVEQKELRDEVYFYNFEYLNSAKLKDLQKILPSGMPVNIREMEYLVTENKSSLIIICGSFYMIGQILNSSHFFQNIAEVVNIY